MSKIILVLVCCVKDCSPNLLYSENLEAERLATGSISFGRFEVESLSWERRSSFSHNRYLEEVEKCSTPGSVTQKRAILEAHFKKKPLLPQASLEHQDEAVYQATNNHSEQQRSYFEELEDHDHEGHPEFAWYDETPAVSDEHEVMVGEQEEEISPLEFPTGCAHHHDLGVLHPSSELADLDQSVQPQPEHHNKPSNEDNLYKVVELEPDNKAVIVEELLVKKEGTIVEELHENKVALSRSSTVEKRKVNSLKKTQKASSKVNEVVEQKNGNSERRTQLSVQQNSRKSLSKGNSVSSVKMSLKSVGKVEGENPSTPKSVKHSTLATSAATSYNSKNLKLELPETMTAKGRKEKISVKDAQTKKVGIPAPSVSRKSEMNIHQTVNRSKEVSDSTKEEVKQSGVIFSFKSEERAERRKEYYIKLEEKLHAKEVEMNEIQARTQEEIEAEIKQLRRRLTFKATPMPSFYHEAVPRVSEGKKVATPRKPQKLQIKCTNGSRSNREKPPAVSESVNGDSLVDETNRAIDSTEKIEAEKKDERSRPAAGQQQQREGVCKKAENINRMRRESVRRKVVKNGMIGGNVTVHVAS